MSIFNLATQPNPPLGVCFHWLGGLASASFYLGFRPVKRWSWETMWLFGGIFSWLIAPFFFANLLVPGADGLYLLNISFHHWPFFSFNWHAGAMDAIKEVFAKDSSVIYWAYFWGVMWGFGGLTYGLTMRYLGLGLGMAVVLSLCAVFGTIMPPIVNLFIAHPASQKTIVEIAKAAPGQLILLGSLVAVVGIILSGMAGMNKEKELPAELKQKAVKEFNFGKGLLVATFSGVMSACFNYGLTAGQPIKDAALAHLNAAHQSDLWANLPVLIVVLWGGLTTNFLWCLYLNIVNKSGGEYLSFSRKEKVADGAVKTVSVPLIFNMICSAIAGTMWYFQFFFYSMGERRMGAYSFASWTLHMSSIIIFGAIWGLLFHEWKGTSHHTRSLVFVGILVLVLADIVIGYGYFFNTLPEYAKPVVAAVQAIRR
jgi:L-rhamnose-H+ transport protein